MKAKGLGRGLDALFDTGNAEQPRASDSLSKLPISQLQRGKYQPRTKMDQTSLEELAASIRAQGLIQPILVRPVDASRYEIIAGERRWRAAGIAGLSEVPVVIRDVPDKARCRSIADRKRSVCIKLVTSFTQPRTNVVTDRRVCLRVLSLRNA